MWITNQTSTMQTNQTYLKINEIDDYLNNLHHEFRNTSEIQTVRDLITKTPRDVLERKYTELLLLSQQLITTLNYALSEERNGDTY